MIIKIINKLYSFFLSRDRKYQFERIIFVTAIIAFIFHFILIILANQGWLPREIYGRNITYLNPIVSIYTPFSIILLYEIYSLIYYLPKSIAIYLGKQYEIVALILIRRIFDTLSKFVTDQSAISQEKIQTLLVTLGGLIVLLLLIFCFYKLSGSKNMRIDESNCQLIAERRFIVIKKILSLILMIVFIALLVRSVFQFDMASVSAYGITETLKTVNNAFFNYFFTALILTEVLLLLFTFNLSRKFIKIIRNSGFIISTILLKLTFQTDGITSVFIIITAISFGVIILAVYRLFEAKLPGIPDFSSTFVNDETNQ